ncbi:hypothetical protein TNCV_3253011 [Trichonephila clavipes]|nr:hypothetical protein TNCV_3253011 [Trichonephila clavipes]
MAHLHLSMPCEGQAQPISFGSLLRAFHPVSLDYIGSNGWVASFKCARQSLPGQCISLAVPFAIPVQSSDPIEGSQPLKNGRMVGSNSLIFWVSPMLAEKSWKNNFLLFLSPPRNMRDSCDSRLNQP